MSHFSNSLAAISGFAVTFGAIVGPVTGGVLVDATSFRSGGQLLWVTSFLVPISWDGRKEHIMRSSDGEQNARFQVFFFAVGSQQVVMSFSIESGPSGLSLVLSI